MIRTIEGRHWQFRWALGGVAFFCYRPRWWTFQLHWWRPRIIFGFADRIVFSFPSWT